MTTITERSQDERPNKISKTALGVLISVGLSVVILAPTALSSQDLFRWATSPTGLALETGWAIVVFIALDLAAVVCIGMVVMATMRGESGGIFHLLTWAFALGSAFANREHALSTPAAGDDWFFPAASVMGPFLLEAVLHRLRKWIKVGKGSASAARPSFGARWIPGVAFRETLRAWAASRREDIERPTDAVAYVRERADLAVMSDVDAVRYAWSALGTYDEYTARVWLRARGRIVSQAALDEATDGRPRSPLSITVEREHAPVPALPPSPPNDDGSPAGSEHPDHAMLISLPTNRDRIRHAFAAVGSYDVPKAIAWLAERGIKADKGDAYAVRKQEQEKARSETLRAVR